MTQEPTTNREICTHKGCGRPLAPQSLACCEYHLDRITEKLEHFAGQCQPASCPLCAEKRANANRSQ